MRGELLGVDPSHTGQLGRYRAGGLEEWGEMGGLEQRDSHQYHQGAWLPEAGRRPGLRTLQKVPSETQ